MPKALLEYMGYCIYFWIGDGEEPVHVHVSKKRQRQDATKFWVTSDSVELAKDTGSVDACDMRDMLRYLRKNRETILSAWLRVFKRAEVKR